MIYHKETNLWARHYNNCSVSTTRGHRNLWTFCFPAPLKCSPPPPEAANGCRWRKCLTLRTQRCLFWRSWFALLGHIGPPYCDPEPPPASSRGLGNWNCPLWGGGTKCQFSPWVNTSQHAWIPPSPKVTLSALQLASSLFLHSDMELERWPVRGAPRWDPALLPVPVVWARPHSTSSFTVTLPGRKRSKQTCGGRKFPTWWIAVISIRQPRVFSDWWRPVWQILRVTERRDARNAARDPIRGRPSPRKRPQVIPRRAPLNVNTAMGKYLQHRSCVFGGRHVYYPLSWQEWGGGGASRPQHSLTPFWTLFTSSATSRFFLSEEERRKARRSPNGTFAQTKSRIVAHFPVSAASHFQGVISIPQGQISARLWSANFTVWDCCGGASLMDMLSTSCCLSCRCWRNGWAAFQQELLEVLVRSLTSVNNNKNGKAGESRKMHRDSRTTLALKKMLRFWKTRSRLDPVDVWPAWLHRFTSINRPQ